MTPLELLRYMKEETDRHRGERGRMTGIALANDICLERTISMFRELRKSADELHKWNEGRGKGFSYDFDEGIAQFTEDLPTEEQLKELEK